jgi:hypothetical protein
MRLSIAILCALAIASPAAAQTHARHTAAHDSAHAIALSDADHVALHQFLLGHWTGTLAARGAARADTLNLRFENDSLHQQLMIRQHDRVAGFVIRGDSLQWEQTVRGSACIASTSVSALVAAARQPASKSTQMQGALLCGKDQSPFTLRKVGAR